MSAPEPPTEPAPRVQPWTLGLIFALMAGGVVVGISYMKRNQYEASSPRPAFVTKIERDLAATDQDGRAVRLSSFKGQVYLAILFSAGERGAADPRPQRLRVLAEEFRGRADFGGLVAFSATPESDSPDLMRGWLERAGWTGGDLPARCLSAPADVSAPFLKRYLRLYPELPEIPPGHPVPYDSRIVLVDRKANVRGYYRVLDAARGEDYWEALRVHLRHVLDHP
jgi:hypothetical protein